MFLKHKSIFWHIVGSFLGLVVTMSFWVFANLVNSVTDVYLISEVTAFMNETLWLVLFTWFVGFVGGFFDRLVFPLSIPAIPIHAFNSIFIVYFFIKLLTLLESVLFIGFLEKILDWQYLGILYPIAFFLTIIGKTLEIFNDNFVHPKQKSINKEAEEVCDDKDLKKVKLWFAEFFENISKRLRK